MLICAGKGRYCQEGFNVCGTIVKRGLMPKGLMYVAQQQQQYSQERFNVYCQERFNGCGTAY